MTKEQLEYILSFDIPNNKKSELIKGLYDSERQSVSIFKEGGKNSEEPLEQNPNEIKKDSIKILRPTETIEVGDLEFDVEIADTDVKRKDGLSRCRRLNDGEGMLFIFDTPVRQYFTMKETPIDLDIIFIDETGTVISVESVEAYDPIPVVCDREYKYVLEVNIDSDVKPGDELDQDDSDFTEEEKENIKKSKMLVLNSAGDVQMKLVGGERIVSMIKTRQLIKAALKAYKTDNDSDYRRVGKLIFNELDAQDGRDPQYVEK